MDVLVFTDQQERERERERFREICASNVTSRYIYVDR